MPIYMRYTRSNGSWVRGGVTAKGYEGWIELQGLQLDHTHGPVNGATRSPTAPPPSSIIVAKQQDSASIELYGESVRGRTGKVQIDFTKIERRKPAAYTTLILEGTTITSYGTSGPGGAGSLGPMETMGIAFDTIAYGHGAALAPAATAAPRWWDFRTPG